MNSICNDNIKDLLKYFNLKELIKIQLINKKFYDLVDFNYLLKIDFPNRDFINNNKQINEFDNKQIYKICYILKKFTKLEIQYLINIQRLYLQNNQIKEIPSEIKYLTNLQGLYLDNNQITEIPSEIKYLINLQELNLENNQIKEIPLEIKYLTNLQILYLGNNQNKGNSIRNTIFN